MGCTRHPLDKRVQVFAGDVFPEDGYCCLKCAAFVPRSRSLRGKRANRRGRNQSAAIARDIGGKNREVEGGPVDASNDLYNVQSKKDNNLFSERYWKLLASIGDEDGRTPVLVVRDAPGPGRKVRGIVVMEYSDWLDLTGVKG